MVCNMRRTSSSRRMDSPATPVGITSGASVAIVKEVDAAAAAAEEEEEDDEDEESALVESEVASVPHCGEAPAPDAVDWCSLAECCCCAAAAVAASVAAGECRRERLVGRELRLMSEAQPCSLEISTTPTGRALLSPRRRGMVTWVDTGDRQPPNSHPPSLVLPLCFGCGDYGGGVLARGKGDEEQSKQPSDKGCDTLAVEMEITTS